MMHIAANARRRSDTTKSSTPSYSSSSSSLGILDYDSSLPSIDENEDKQDLSLAVLRKYKDQCFNALKENCYSFSLSYTHFHFLYIFTVGILGALTIFGLEHGKYAFIDCLFTAFSAITVTGLITLDTSILTTGSQVTIVILILAGGVVLLSTVPVLIRRHYIKKHLVETIRDRTEINRILTTEAVEYQALGYVLKFTLAYWLVIQFLIMFALVIAIETSPEIKNLLDNQHVNSWWWAIFHSVSSFNNAGFALFADNLMSFYKYSSILLPLSASILFGNIMFPICLRLLVWIVHRIKPDNKGLKYLLDHPRKCFTHLFPSLTTFVLFSVLVSTTLLEYFIFLILDFRSDAFAIYQPIERGLVIWFQSISTRTAGFNCIDVSTISNGVLVLEIWLMYLSAFPVLLTIRQTEKTKTVDGSNRLLNSSISPSSSSSFTKTSMNQTSTTGLPPPAIVSSDVLIGLSLRNIPSTKELSNEVKENRSQEYNKTSTAPSTDPMDSFPIPQNEAQRRSLSRSNYRYSDILAMDGIVVPTHDIAPNAPEIEITETGPKEPKSSVEPHTTTTAGVESIKAEEEGQIASPSIGNSFGSKRTSLSSSSSDDALNGSKNLENSEKTVAVSTTRYTRNRNESVIELRTPIEPSDIFVVDKKAEKLSKHVQLLYGLTRRVRDITSKDTSLLFLGLFFITAVDNTLLKHDTTGRLNAFTVFYEIVSAYGTVGFSTGTVNSVLSLSAVLSTFSKLVIIFIMILGRHRGLPSAIDPVVDLATLLNQADRPKVEISPENLLTIGRNVLQRTSSLILRGVVTDSNNNNHPTRSTGGGLVRENSTSRGTGLVNTVETTSVSS